MSGITEPPNVPDTNTNTEPVPVSEPAPAGPAPSAPAPITPSPPVQYPAPLDPHVLAQAFSQAMAPLMPKPQAPTPIWETDEVLADRKSLFNGVGQYYTSQQEKYHTEKIQPFLDELAQIKQLLPQLLARSAENPNFSVLDTQAKEMVKDYNINYWQAYQIAQKNFATQAKNSVTNRSIPNHLSSPDTRQNNIPESLDSGPAEFGSIVKALRAKHGNNI